MTGQGARDLNEGGVPHAGGGRGFRRHRELGLQRA